MEFDIEKMELSDITTVENLRKELEEKQKIYDYDMEIKILRQCEGDSLVGWADRNNMYNLAGYVIFKDKKIIRIISYDIVGE